MTKLLNCNQCFSFIIFSKAFFSKASPCTPKFQEQKRKTSPLTAETVQLRQITSPQLLLSLENRPSTPICLTELSNRKKWVIKSNRDYMRRLIWTEEVGYDSVNKRTNWCSLSRGRKWRMEEKEERRKEGRNEKNEGRRGEKRDSWYVEKRGVCVNCWRALEKKGQINKGTTPE